MHPLCSKVSIEVVLQKDPSILGAIRSIVVPLDAIKILVPYANHEDVAKPGRIVATSELSTIPPVTDLHLGKVVKQVGVSDLERIKGLREVSGEIG